MASGKPTKYFQSRKKHKKKRGGKKLKVSIAPIIKKVRFAEKLDNDASLDSAMRERIEHNLRYNDDTIFDGMAIFNQDDSLVLSRPKKVREKEKYPSAAALLQMEAEDEESETRQQHSAIYDLSKED